MSELTVQDGKLVVRNGTLGTGRGCCCGGETGVCCLNNGSCTTEYGTRQECEECVPENTCYEYMFLENPEDPCPEGWTGSGGYCERTTTPQSCDDCDGYCLEQIVGPCGHWKAGKVCEDAPCCVGPCETASDCAESCECPCIGEKTEEFAIIRGAVQNNDEIQDTIDFLESIGYRNVRYELQNPEGDTWLGTCCGAWCQFIGYWTVGGVPYNVCGCENAKSCTEPENPLP